MAQIPASPAQGGETLTPIYRLLSDLQDADTVLISGLVKAGKGFAPLSVWYKKGQVLSLKGESLPPTAITEHFSTRSNLVIRLSHKDNAIDCLFYLDSTTGMRHSVPTNCGRCKRIMKVF